MRVIKSKIALIGAYGEGNIGDDLLMYNVVSWFNKMMPNVVPLLVVRDKKLVTHFLKELKVDVVDDYMSYEVNCDTVIYGGGTQFFDFGSLNKKSIFQRRVEQFKAPVKTLKKKKFKKQINYKKSILLGVGLGPFSSRQSLGYIKFKNTINNSNHIYVRDIKSYNYAQEICTTNLYLGTDLCYNSLFYEMVSNYIKKDSSIKIKKVGIVLRQWDYDNINQDQLFTTIKKYIEFRKNDFDFDLILFRKKKDKEILKHFKSLKDTSVYIWDSEEDSFDNFLKKYSTYDLIITSRFHGAIISGLLEIPFITIEVDPKLQIPNNLYNNENILSSPFNYKELDKIVLEMNNTIKDNYKLYNKNIVKKGDEMLKNVFSVLKDI